MTATGFRSFFRPAALLLALVFATAVALPFYTHNSSRRDVFYFEANMASDSAGTVQVFFDAGNGINEQDSASQPVDAGEKPSLHRFGLAPGRYRTIRFDPLNHAGVVFIANVRIVTSKGKVLRQLTADEFRPNSQVARVTVRKDGWEVQTVPNANDPNLELALTEPLDLRVGPEYWARQTAQAFAFAFLAALALAAIPVPRLLASRAGRIIPWSRAHPGRAIALLSVVIVAIQCHPVIFFGKSFVSPNNAVLLLYDEFPVLPGYKSTVQENAQASDVGALMFWHLYCPVIAHDALFRDHELPLWNRYTMDGLPLLGQGQSMFGDPLNWLSILSRSAAWSWDLRFVISRWLLCCGLGLVVWRLTRHLASALLVTVGAGFLGFFEFRLNHPANFSLCYSPWILVAWIHICQAGTIRQAGRWTLALVLANFSVMNSGTMKEAYMLILGLNLAGLLLLLLDGPPWRERLRRLAMCTGGGLVLVLLTAPLLLTFFSSLKQSWTTYDTPSASQAQLVYLVGLFEDLFTRQLRPGEITFLPAGNFLFLLGVLWALLSFRELVFRRSFVAMGLAATLPFAMAFGIIPASFITRVPFIANILHIDNTMFCVLIILSAVLAGYGFEILFRQIGRPALKGDYAVFLLLLAALLALYVSASQNVPKSGFFIGYAWGLIIALVALPLGLHFARKLNDDRLFCATLLTGLFLLTWRHSQYLSNPFNDYVLNPQVRTDLHPRSPAVDFVNAQMKEPSRPLAFGLNLFPGYNQMLGWESILGVDPLRNRYHDELAAAFGLLRVRNADTPSFDEAQTPDFTAGLDLFNVRYHLATHSAVPREIPGLKRLGGFDLDVYESPTAWPRAFFTDRLWFYREVGQLVAKVKAGDRQPFAAAQSGDRTPPADAELMSHELAGRTIKPATDYRLTTNTTSFKVDAPSAGVIILSEAYYRDEFTVTVNGEPRDYFRVNHSSKGIYVNAPGTYRIEFDYWPRHLTFALVLSMLGLVIAGAAALILFRKEPAAVSL